MNKEIIKVACEIMSEADITFPEKDMQAICYYAYKTGDADRVKAFVSELEHAETRYAYVNIFDRYCSELKVEDSLETLAEKTLVYVERYRLGQERAIEYLTETLRLNGISISDEEIRTMDMEEIKEKIKERAAR